MPYLDCLSYWFPKLLAASVPVPRTEIVRTETPLVELLDGREPDGFKALLDRLHAAALAVGGYPVFLRTGHGSGKHDWPQTCHVPARADLRRHVANLVAWGHLVDLLGLPTAVWAVREYVALDAGFTAFGGLPVARERRYFIAGGQVLCHHPYWPADAIREGTGYGPPPSVPDCEARLEELNRGDGRGSGPAHPLERAGQPPL